jgi:hypothetical protein
MYVTTLAASLVTAYNLYVTVATAPNAALISVIGAWAMIAIAVLLFVAAVVIAYDAWQSWGRLRGAPTAPAPAASA